MSARLRLIAFAAGLLAAGASAQEQSAPPEDNTGALAHVKAQVAACEGQKFEFKTGDEAHATRITLCSKKGASKGEIAAMLESAAATIQANDRLPAEKKAALVAQLKAKVIEIQAASGALALGSSIVTPAPVTPPPTTALVMPPATAAPSKPRLTFACSTPGQLSEDGACDPLERETILRVRADEDVPAGTSLRFLRRGDMRAEVGLAQIGKGQSVRVKVPAAVCSGVARSKVEVQVLSSGQVVDSLGPLQLHC